MAMTIRLQGEDGEKIEEVHDTQGVPSACPVEDSRSTRH